MNQAKHQNRPILLFAVALPKEPRYGKVLLSKLH